MFSCFFIKTYSYLLLLGSLFMVQSSKYIGQGYVIDYLLQFYLKDKFKSITALSSQDNISKLNFIVENENGAKLGIHVIQITVRLLLLLNINLICFY